MIISNCNIKKIKNIEIIVNPISSIGQIFSEFSYDLSLACGNELESNIIDLNKNNKYQLGDCYVSSPGKLATKGVKYIYNIVVIDYPTDLISMDILKISLENAIKMAILNESKSIGITGIGLHDLPKDHIAKETTIIANRFTDSIDIMIFDKDKEFIDLIKRYQLL